MPVRRFAGPCRFAGEWREDRLDRVGRDEGQVDGEHQDRVGATGHRVVAGLADAGVQAAGALSKGPGTEVGRHGEDLGVGADDQDVVEAFDGQGGHHGPCQQPGDELMPLFGIERLAETSLGALEVGHRDDRGDPHGCGGWPVARLRPSAHPRPVA